MFFWGKGSQILFPLIVISHFNVITIKGPVLYLTRGGHLEMSLSSPAPFHLHYITSDYYAENHMLARGSDGAK